MSKPMPCLKVQKRQGEKALTLANRLKVVDKELALQRDDSHVYIPLVDRPSPSQSRMLIKQLGTYEVTTHVFQKRPKISQSLLELLGERLPPNLLANLPRSIDFLGEIAVVEIPPMLEEHKKLIGEGVLETNRRIRTVLAKAGAIKGTYRLRNFDLIAGEPRTETVHRENGCRYHLDVTKVYFSPRLSTEHNRVANLVGEGETIVDLFAGIGPFAVLIAKKRRKVKVFAIDANSYAVKYLNENVRLNRVEGRVVPILGDARAIVEERLSGAADRVIMNLPEKALDFVAVACKAIKQTGGVAHFYGFVSASDSLENMEQRFREALEKCGRKLSEVQLTKLVRATAPYEWQAVLDAKIH